MNKPSRTSERLSGIAERVFGRFKGSESRSGSKRDLGPQGEYSNMSRVTDAAGNEYLCPVKELKNPNFVRENEKYNCYDYDLVYTRAVE